MAKASKEIIQKHEQMFYPTVRVRTKKAGGSGTVVYSKKYEDEYYTYVITNHHVIADSVKIEKKWDSVLKRKVDKEKLDTVFVEFFRYNNYSHTVGSFAVEAERFQRYQVYFRSATRATNCKGTSTPTAALSLP